MMKTIHIDPSKGDTEQKLSALQKTIGELLEGDEPISVTVARENALLSPQEAADRLGFSRQHVRRLIDGAELEANKLPSSSHWKIPLSSVLDFEQRRADADQRADEFSRRLDEMGAPAE